MKTVLRISAALLGLGLLGGVVRLGVLSRLDNTFVVWFGIASAIAAPTGFALLSYSLAQSGSDAIQRLASVPEIQTLIAQAKTQEQKIRVLEEEEASLVETIRLESRRQAARDRIESLERDAVRIVQELDMLDEEMRLIDAPVGESVSRNEINRLRERIKARERGDVVFHLGNRVYRLDRDIIKAMPLGLGNLTLAYFRVFERVQARLRSARLTRAEHENPQRRSVQ